MAVAVAVAETMVNKHNEAGVSVLGCDGKRYVVDEGTASYFYEIEALVEKGPETPEAVEGRQIPAGNALEEAVGFRDGPRRWTRGAAASWRSSSRRARTTTWCVTSRASRRRRRTSSYHVEEPAPFWKLASRSTRIGLRDGSSVGRNPTECRCWKTRRRCNRWFTHRAAVDSAYDPRVSPVARKFLSLLSDASARPRPRRKPRGKLKGGTSSAGTFADSATRLPNAIASTPCSPLSDTHRRARVRVVEPDGGQLWSAFLQAMLNAPRDVAALNWIIPGFLGCAPGGRHEGAGNSATAGESDIKQLCDGSGSRICSRRSQRARAAKVC